MIPDIILDSLPIKFYVINLKERKIIKTNDPTVSIGQESCFLSIFNCKDSCQPEKGTCFCELLNDRKEFQNVVESGPRLKRRYYKADVKRIDENHSLATFTEITQIMTSEKEIKINNQRLKRAENLVTFGSWEIDLRTNMLYATDGAYKIYGMKKKELLLTDVRDIPLPEYQKMIETALWELINKKIPYNIRFKIRRQSDGEIRFIHSVAEYREDKKLVFGIIRDTTEFERYQNALNDSLTDLKMAQTIAKLGNWKYDPETNTHSISGQIRDIFGGREILGSINIADFENFAGKDNYRLLKGLIYRAINSGVGFQEQFHIKLENGTKKWIELICQPDQKKQTSGYALRGVIKDITDSKNIEIELRNSNNLFRTLIQNMPDAMYMKDIEARKIIANEEDIRNCGLEHEEQVLGKTDFDIYPVEVAQKFYEDDMKVLKKGLHIMNREEELPGNPRKWILTSKIPLKDENGNITGLVGVGHDITHRKKMIEELKAAKLKAEESDRLKSLFLANMSHEIRTPLNGILGFTNLICSNSVEPEQFSMYGKIIESCGMRLTTLIDDIIDISLIQSNQLRLSFSWFNVHDLLKELYTFYRNVKQDHLTNVDFRFSNLSELESSRFYSDRQRIYQVLRNLLDNAIKFTHEGFIEYGCYSSGKDELTFYVEDTGIGIEKSKQQIIFENFRQVEEGLSRNYEGAGLGLSIVSGIVKQLGGKVKLKSKACGGTVFYITIPVAVEETGVVPPDTEQDDWGEPVQMNSEVNEIVSIEDDPASIAYLKSVTKSLGYSFNNFTDPARGIEYIKQRKPGLVFMDVRLPGISGLEATRILKSEFPDLPIVIQTACAMKEDQVNAMNSGCDAYLTKPLSLELLEETVAKYLGGNNSKRTS